MRKLIAPEVKVAIIKHYINTGKAHECTKIWGVNISTVYRYIKQYYTKPDRIIYTHSVIDIMDDQFCLSLSSTSKKKIGVHKLQINYLIERLLNRLDKM